MTTPNIYRAVSAILAVIAIFTEANDQLVFAMYAAAFLVMACIWDGVEYLDRKMK